MENSNTLNSVYPKENRDNLLRITEVQTYNISIGDIFSILEEYKKVSGNTLEKIYFIYCMKILYSMLLLELYLKAVKENSYTDISSNYEEKNEMYLEQYLTIVNAKIMPDSFIYFEVPKNNKSQLNNTLGVRYESYYRLMKDEKLNVDFIEKVTYSDVSVGGEIRALNRATLGNEYTRDKYDIFKYRYFFNYDELKLTHSYQYLYDPFAFAAKKSYTEKTITEIGRKNHYVFYSLFDIDIFTRINYTRQSQQNENDLRYALRKINKIFNQNAEFKQTQSSEISFLKRLNGFIFESENFPRENVYTNEEIEFSNYFFDYMVLDKERISNLEKKASNMIKQNKITHSKSTRMKKYDYLKRAENILKIGNPTDEDYKALLKSVSRFDNSISAQLKNDEKQLLLKLEDKYNIDIDEE